MIKDSNESLIETLNLKNEWWDMYCKLRWVMGYVLYITMSDGICIVNFDDLLETETY